ncbi:hypothetical protein [Janibacter sp. DB-40]|uniref:hypothetical protein n=1 Tax=Janibacter sp. DB-40 TaxID=3028808 RepID=UPI0024073C64|nr:hypothetical protein [Janibacter sp. DB-40]
MDSWVGHIDDLDEPEEGAYRGFIKLRLVHGRDRSLLLPDQVVVQGSGTFWLQPQSFYAPILLLDEPGYTQLHLAVANRWGRDVVIRVDVQGDSHVASLTDRSQIYRCTIHGPRNLDRLKAGRARVRTDGGFNLRLYHHTSKSSRSLILESQEVWGSAWNFQGTRELANCRFAYFTSLDRIEKDADLQRIAMSGTGRLGLRLDQSSDGAPPDLVLEVYRERTENRKGRIPLWVPAEHVSPSHIYEHHGVGVEYEVAHPWIHRVGLEPGATYAFVGDKAVLDQNGLKRFDYFVIGDCRTKAGLAAPYDEDVTDETFQIQDLGEATIFQFWREHCNQNHMHGDIETQEFLD